MCCCDWCRHRLRLPLLAVDRCCCSFVACRLSGLFFLFTWWSSEYGGRALLVVMQCLTREDQRGVTQSTPSRRYGFRHLLDASSYVEFDIVTSIRIRHSCIAALAPDHLMLSAMHVPASSTSCFQQGHHGRIPIPDTSSTYTLCTQEQGHRPEAHGCHALLRA